MIVTMCTQSYLDWIPYFYFSIRQYNKQIPIKLYLINVKPEDKELVQRTFPDIIIEEVNMHTELKETYNVYCRKEKVTFLKGRFMYESFNQYKTPVLWIDITAYIRTDLKEVFEALNENDVVLVRRNFKKDKGKMIYAAEIFGISDLEQLELYCIGCESRKHEWFADQLSLCEFTTTKKHYLKFREYCNFYYDHNAKDDRDWETI